jgi:ligand-binding sensor domain-containing protein
VESIYQDNRGIVWVGTGKQGVSYLNENITQFELYDMKWGIQIVYPIMMLPTFWKTKRVFLDRDDGGGLLYFDRVRNRFTQYLHDPANTNSLCNIVGGKYLCSGHEN